MRGLFLPSAVWLLTSNTVGFLRLAAPTGSVALEIGHTNVGFAAGNFVDRSTMHDAAGVGGSFVRPARTRQRCNYKSHDGCCLRRCLHLSRVGAETVGVLKLLCPVAN